MYDFATGFNHWLLAATDLQDILRTVTSLFLYRELQIRTYHQRPPLGQPSSKINCLIMPYKKVQPLLAEDVEIQDSSTEDLPLYEYPRKHRNCCTNFRSRPPHWPWMLSTVFFACTTILLLIHSPVRFTRFSLNLQKYGLSSELRMCCIVHCKNFKPLTGIQKQLVRASSMRISFGPVVLKKMITVKVSHHICD
jgi:hypothetical protein